MGEDHTTYCLVFDDGWRLHCRYPSDVGPGKWRNVRLGVATRADLVEAIWRAKPLLKEVEQEIAKERRKNWRNVVLPAILDYDVTSAGELPIGALALVDQWHRGKGSQDKAVRAHNEATVYRFVEWCVLEKGLLGLLGDVDRPLAIEFLTHLRAERGLTPRGILKYRGPLSSYWSHLERVRAVKNNPWEERPQRLADLSAVSSDLFYMLHNGFLENTGGSHARAHAEFLKFAKRLVPVSMRDWVTDEDILAYRRRGAPIPAALWNPAMTDLQM